MEGEEGKEEGKDGRMGGGFLIFQSSILPTFHPKTLHVSRFTHGSEGLKMSIGFWEVVVLLIIFLGVLLISRYQTKRICPRCGFAIRSYTPDCPECGLVFPKKNSIQGR